MALVTGRAPEGGMGDGSAAVEVGRDPRTWDARIEASPHGSYLQLSGWAAVKAMTGWRAERVADPGGRVLAQVLLRGAGPLPWRFAYVPRGPVVEAWSAELVEPMTTLLRGALAAAGERVSHLRIEPDVERDGPEDEDGSLRAALVAAGWRPAPAIQPETTRLIDLRLDEAALWAGLRQKWRQYVNRARSRGVRVVEAGSAGLSAFARIVAETARRTGVPVRSEAAYRAIWDAFAAEGRCRLLLAELDGEPVAGLFLVRCGGRVTELYGGMTTLGAEHRASYLVKWEAIRTARALGATTYDLWGLVTPGIAHFKAGFGGREVRYVGAWDLVLDPLGRRAWEGGLAARRWLLRRVRRRPSAAEDGA
ncbi:MAG TPA: peptidoglycan bridge formation glycyltransferase FemA/FemB family protein [Candidatus Binatia bacterium]|nr:peptidoglycan bridge formation glycyltransferase FemA/FemB family protein [Candidatus Binatia bacterium]